MHAAIGRFSVHYISVYAFSCRTNSSAFLEGDYNAAKVIGTVYIGGIDRPVSAPRPESQQTGIDTAARCTAAVHKLQLLQMSQVAHNDAISNSRGMYVS